MELIRVNGKTTTARFNRALNGLMEDVFGFSFARFQALGVWDEQYEYFSVMDESKMMRTAGLSHADGGGRHQAGVLAVQSCRGAPLTRGKGLGRLVMEQALGEYRTCLPFCMPIWMRSSSIQAGLCPPRGKAAVCHGKAWATSPDWKAGTHLSGGREYLASTRVFPTPRLHRPVCLNWFHLVYQFQDNLYHVPELGVMLVMEERGSEVFLHDVAAPQKVAFEHLLPTFKEKGWRESAWLPPDRLEAAGRLNRAQIRFSSDGKRLGG